MLILPMSGSQMINLVRLKTGAIIALARTTDNSHELSEKLCQPPLIQNTLQN